MLGKIEDETPCTTLCKPMLYAQASVSLQKVCLDVLRLKNENVGLLLAHGNMPLAFLNEYHFTGFKDMFLAVHVDDESAVKDV